MRKKLLLADDSITIQKVVELTFPSDEFEVVTAGNGRIAVDKAAAFGPDMVLCDVIMPQLDGYQVCEALRAMPQLQDVPILLLNGAFEPYDADRARAVGALGNVSKPFDPPALVARVKEILAQRASLAAVVAETMPMEELATVPALEEAAEVETFESSPQIHHEYSYDDPETSPVSTIEVPMGVREMAARSLSLDSPVFAPQEPEVLTDEAVLSETLHGPLDAVAESAPPDPLMEAVAAEEMPDLEPLAAAEFDGEMPEPGPAMDLAPTEPPVEELPAAEQALGLDAESDLGAEALPKTLPPMSSPFVEPEVHASSSVEHEFEPDALESPEAAGVPDAFDPGAAPEPDASESARTLEADHEAEPESAPAPAAEAREAAIDDETGAFDGLVGQPAEPPLAPVVAPLPSAEVAVPVDMVQQIAQRVISQVSERVIREIAWEVIPVIAEKLVKAEIERIKARAESEHD